MQVLFILFIEKYVFLCIICTEFKFSRGKRNKWHGIAREKMMTEQSNNKAEAEDSGNKKRDLVAFAAGMSCYVSRGLGRVAAYHNLLEDEWEGRRSALDFLHEGSQIIDAVLKWDKLFKDNAVKVLNNELLAVCPMVEGVPGMLRKLHGVDATVSCKDAAIVVADAFMLQEAMLDIAASVAAASKVDAISFACCKMALDNSDIRILRAEIIAGEYVVVSIAPQSAGAETDIDMGDYGAAVDFHSPDSDDPSFMRWIGAAALHNGELLLHKDGIDKGAMLILPVSNSDSEDNLRAHDNNGHKEMILLVDDEDMIWDVVMSMLRDLDYEVILAENGKDAVDIYCANKGNIDLVLLDMLMPVMNAREAFYLLKKADPDVKVLLASGYVDEADVQDLLNAGARGFMRKPYRMRDLARRIRDILDKAQRN